MTTTEDPYDAEALRALAVEAAEGAGSLLLDYARQLADGVDLGIGAKSTATDPVSEADRAAERAIIERLTAARPDDGVLGEEGQGSRSGSSGLTWVIDPLDGTVNFLYGIPLWCVSIACVGPDGPLAGVVTHPPSGETIHAARGGGTRLGDRPVGVRETGEVTEALVATGFTYDRDRRTDWGHTVGQLLGELRDIRRCGAAALDLAWVAAGRFDGYVEFGMQRWDWAAGELLVTEAGGRFSHVSRRLGGEDITGVVAATPAVHDHLRHQLEELS
ncbi:MAG: inositol monophosphatase family protein [Nitriliruptoraceae bacterium]